MLNWILNDQLHGSRSLQIIDAVLDRVAVSLETFVLHPVPVPVETTITYITYGYIEDTVVTMAVFILETHNFASGRIMRPSILFV